MAHSATASSIRLAQALVWMALGIAQFVAGGVTALLIAWAAVWCGFWVGTGNWEYGQHFCGAMTMAVICFACVMYLARLRIAAMFSFRKLLTRITGVSVDEPFFE